MITTKIKPRLEDLPMGERKEVWIALILSCLQGIAKRTKQNKKKNKTKQKTKKQKCLIKFTAFEGIVPARFVKISTMLDGRLYPSLFSAITLT